MTRRSGRRLAAVLCVAAVGRQVGLLGGGVARGRVSRVGATAYLYGAVPTGR